MGDQLSQTIIDRLFEDNQTYWLIIVLNRLTSFIVIGLREYSEENPIRL